RRGHRARVQHAPGRGRGQAPRGPQRRAGRPDRPDPARGQPPVAAARALSGLLERGGPRRPPHRGQLPVPGQVMVEAVAWLVRWVGFVALAGLVGGLAVDLLVLSAHAPELGAVRGRLRALRTGSALVLLAASGGELLLRAATMSGTGLGAAGAAVPAVLMRT